MKKIQWGILGTATIAVEQVIPAIQHSKLGELAAIASRNLHKAKHAALQYNIPEYYDSYDDLLADAQVEAVYIPLPNHLHVEWTIKALKAGKHVLVEKPIGMNSEEAQILLEEARNHPLLKVMEAFMYRFHPQWIHVKNMVKNGRIGSLKMIQSSFSFFDDDPDSIVNVNQYGGGSLMDVGCYPVSISRYLFESEPKRIISSMDYHPDYRVDITSSGVLEFEEGRTVFFSSIQMMEHQEVKLIGTKGIIEFELPFNPPNDRPVHVTLLTEDEKEKFTFEPCNQYELQLDAFSKSILEGSDSKISLEDSVNNMKVIEAIKKAEM